MNELDLGSTIRGFSAGQKVFGRFVLQRILGRGGMGVVWLARDEKLEREVALKFLPEILKSDRAAMEELRGETRRALGLTHSNIVRIHDFFEDASMTAIAMEHVPGDTLANRRLERPGHVFEVDELRRWIRQLCDAIAYAHEKGRVVHRDLKPANLMLDAHGDLKVADFGIARSISDSVSRISAQAGSSGTPAYMSPQQMMGEKPVPADDVYAIGATLYELLTGKPPFHSGNLIAQVQSKVPARVSARREELGVGGAPIPVEWDETIAACLAKEAEQRPGSARAVAQGLGVALSHTAAPFAPRPDTRPPTPVAAVPALAMPAPAAPAPRGPSWLLVASLLLVVALGAGAAWYWNVWLPSEQARAAEAAATAARAAQGEAVERAARAAEELRARLAAGTVPPDELAALALESTPRGQVARLFQAEQERAREEAAEDAFRAISGAVERLTVLDPRALYDELDARVRSYLPTASERHRRELQAAWQRRSAAWLAHEAANRTGSLVVETDPPGATVTLYPRNERRTSPATFQELKPGEVTFRVEKDGYEPVDVPYSIRPGVENRPGAVRLVALHGSVRVSSEPAGLRIVLEGEGRRFEGVTPFAQATLGPGTYRVTFERAGWQPQQKVVTVERGRESSAHADLRGAALEIRVEPAGAELMLDGRPIGRSPVRLAEIEKRTYRIEASAEGHEPAARTIELTRDETVAFTLAERPAYQMLRRLAGHNWRLSRPWGYAELRFEMDGSISGNHKIPLAAVMQDSGSVVHVDPSGRLLRAKFVPSQPHPFYTGDVDIKLLDDYTIEVGWNWYIGGKRHTYDYRRADAPAETGKRKR